MLSRRFPLSYSTTGSLVVLLAAACNGTAQTTTTPVPGTNVNMVSGTKWPLGDPFLTKQNEPSIAVSSLNSQHLLAGSNDYRLVDLSTLPDIPGEVSAGDAWVSVYKSVDGGMTWRSTVLSGCPPNVVECNSPLSAAVKGLGFAADPTVRPGPYGSFFYSFIAGNRGTGNNGIIAVQRFFDRNDNIKFSDDPFQADVVNVLDRGTTGQLKDKSWNAADIPGRPWNGGNTCVIPGYSAPVPAFNVYVSFSNFVGQDPNNPHPQILVARSTNCGLTYEKPVKISQSVATNSGTSIGIDPTTGHVYVTWRQFFTVANGNPDAIFFSRSTDGGVKFSNPILITNFTPFDQGTSATSFRTNAFPTLAASVDKFGVSRVHVAFTQRTGVNGDARIFIATSSDGGLSWPAPVPVDNWSMDPINPVNPGRGHQLQPSLLFAGGKIFIVWIDQRHDHTVGVWACPVGQTCTSFAQFVETRKPAGNLAGAAPQLSTVFTPFLTDGTAGLTRRHHVDVFTGLADPDSPCLLPAGGCQAFAVSKVSEYLSGNTINTPKSSKPVVQLRFNAPSVPIFVNNTAGFLGDYIDGGAQLFEPTGNAAQPYKFSTSPKQTVFHAAWTDNRDVDPPKDGVWGNHTPIQKLFTNPNGTVTTVNNPGCLPGQDGSRNQNVYTSRITQGAAVSSSGTSKKLNATTPRGFVVTVQNNQQLPTAGRTFILTILPGPNVTASFLQSMLPLNSIIVTVPPRSTASRTVWVVSSTPGGSLKVQVTDQATNQIVDTINLNGDPLSTLVLNADLTNVDLTNVDLTNVELTNVELTNGELPNVDLTNVDLTNVELTNVDLTNVELTNVDLTNVDLTNVELTNVDLTNVDLTNVELTNVELTNVDLTNNTFTNVDLTNVDLTNGAIADATFTLINRSNVDETVNVKTLLRNKQIPPGFKVQLVLRKATYVPTARGSCKIGLLQQDNQVANIPTPKIENPDDEANLGTFNPNTSSGADVATIPLLAGEKALVTLRVLGQTAAAANNLGGTGTKFVGIGATGTVTPIPLIIKTLALPNGAYLTPYVHSPQPLEAFGGTGARMWTVTGLPAGLIANSSTGLITGTPTVAGTFTVSTAVSDSSNPVQNDSQSLALLINTVSQTISFTPLGFASKTFGDPPFAVAATASSGLAVSFSASGNCSVAGSLVTITGAGNCTITASQPGDPTSYSPAPSQQQSFAILKANQLISFAALAGRTYGDPPFAVAATASSGLAVSFSATGACTATAGGTVTITGAGTCDVTASQAGNANYNAAPAVIQSFAIAKAALNVTAANASRVYGAANPVFTGTLVGAVNADVITAAYTTTATVTSAVGAYPITPALSAAAGVLANYDVTSINGTFTITVAGLTVTANNAARTYGAANPVFTGSITGLLNGDVVTATYGTAATPASPVGAYPILPTLVDPNSVLGNYAVTVNNGVLTVTTAALTVQTNNAVKNYGDPLPAFNASFIGFVLGETPSALGGVLMFSTTAGALSPAGAPLPLVTPGGLTSTNYAIAFVPGTLTILKITPSFSNLSSPVITPGTPNTLLSGKIANGTLYPSGSVSITLNGVTQLAPINAADGAFSSSFLTAGLAPGSHPVTYNYAGDVNFNPAAAGNSTVKVEGFAATGDLRLARSYHTATLLTSGKVLITGGFDATGASTATAEIYEPATGITRSVGNLPSKSAGHTATLLLNGKVLLAGGGNSSSELFDPVTETHTGTGGMSSTRSYHIAVLLGNGKVLIAGGSDNAGKVLNSTILYTPATGSFSAGPNLATAREFHTATMLPNGKVLLTGGRNKVSGKFVYLSSTEIYDPAANTFTAAGAMSLARYQHSAVLTAGKVLVSGGSDGTVELATSQIFDPATGLFTAAGSLGTARRIHTATLLADGRILAAGGQNGANRLQSAELYVGAAFSATGSMGTARGAHTATLLNDGRVLVAGGVGAGGASIAKAELFHPAQ